jgi:hypothetical protein
MPSQSSLSFCKSTFNISLCATSKDGKNSLKNLFKLSQTDSTLPENVFSIPL